MRAYIVTCSGPYIGISPDAPWTRVEAVYATREQAEHTAVEWNEIEADLDRGRSYVVEEETVLGLVDGAVHARSVRVGIEESPSC